jgi:hypothetical protein
VKFGKFSNVPLFEKKNSDLVQPVEPEAMCVIIHLENLKTTTIGIIPTGLVSDI